MSLSRKRQGGDESPHSKELLQEIRYVKTTYPVILVSLCVAGVMAATNPASAETATAHAPHYDDKELWPHDVEKRHFYKQEWPPAPVMIWAKTNEARIRVDHRDPANWLIDGKPATRLPDRHTDVVIPDGKYHVSSNTKQVFLNCRHATVGKNVRFGFELRAKGNVWIKQGGSVLCSSWSGPNDVFVRNDNHDFMDRRTQLANKIVIAKASDASIEVVDS
jgi:hypothetical protein